MRSNRIKNTLIFSFLMFSLLFVTIWVIAVAGAVGPEAINACEVNGTEYATLDAALATLADNTPATITMLKDFTDSDGIILSRKKITLVLNGKTLTIQNNAGTGIEMKLLSELNITGPGVLNIDAQMAGLSMNQSKLFAAESVDVEINSDANLGLYTDTECIVSIHGNVSGASGGIYASTDNTITVNGIATATGSGENHAVHLNNTGNTVQVGSAIVSSGTGCGIHIGTSSGGSVTVGSAAAPGQVVGKGHGIWVRMGITPAAVTVYGNVEGASHGISASDDSTITVYGNVKTTSVASDRYGVYCLANSDHPSNIIINGNVIGVNGVYVHGAQSEMTINGDVTANGTDAVNNVGARASYARLHISGSITANSCIGAYSFESSEIIIDGTISAANYIKAKYANKTIADTDAVSTKALYRQYSSADAFIWVKEAEVIEVGNSAELFAALGRISNGGIIKLTASFNCSAGILIDGKSITLNVGTYTLNVSNTIGPGLEVKNSGQIDLVGTGAFNVESTGTGNTGIYNGVVARAGSKATVTNARTTNIFGRGAYAEDPGAVITILGNVESIGDYGYGVQVWNGGYITVNGTITAKDRYLSIDSSPMSMSEGVSDLVKTGYIKYSVPGVDGAIWVKEVIIVNYICEISGTQYETLDAALASIPEWGTATIKLLKNINHNAGVVLDGKKVTFDLNGYILNINNPAENGIGLNVYNGGAVYLTGSGALNVTGKAYGVTVASNTLFSEATVTNATANGPDGKAAHAYNRASLTVLGDVTATGVRTFGVHSQAGAYIEVRGNVSADNQGVCVSSATAKVIGNVQANGNDLIGNPEGIGVNVYDGVAEIGGNVTANRVGAMIRAGGSITLDGTLNAPDYIQFTDDAPVTIDGYLAVTTKAGYRTYQHPLAGTVWIKGEITLTTYNLSVINGTGSGSYIKDTIVTVIANPAPAGQRFKEWSITPSVVFADSTDKNSETAKFIMPGQTVTTTAVYEAIKYTITIQNDGNGTASANYSSAAGGTEVTLTATPNTGYKFKEWQVISGNVAINNNKFNIPASDVIVKAIFELIPTYMASINGGTGGGNYAEGATVNIIANAAAPGKVFDRWTTSDGVIFADVYATTTSFTMPAKAVNVTATYKDLPSETFTISFNSNGGSEVTAITQNFNTSVNKPNNPIKLGYIFSGWYYDSGLTSAVTWPYSLTANVTFYAKWSASQYTITFNANGGSNVSAITQDYGSSVVKPADPVKEGYTFSGWYYDSKLTKPVIWPYTMSFTGATFYAKWTQKQYTVSFNSNEGTSVASITLDFNSIIAKPADPTKTGYTFSGWYYDSGLTSAVTWPYTLATNVTFYAKWTINQYTVLFNSNGGSSISSITQAYNSSVSKPADPTKTGYTFAGWYSDSGMTYAVKWPYIITTSNVTFYAKWTVSQYTVSFDTNGGSSVSSITGDNNTEVTISATSSKTGYTFIGWNTKADGTGIGYSRWGKITLTENITLYAIWSEDRTVPVSESEGTYYAPISPDDASVIGDVISDLGNVEIYVPADVYENIIGSDNTSTLRISQTLSNSSSVDAIEESIGENNTVVVSFDISLEKVYPNGNIEQIHELSSSIRIIINLTAEQISAITDPAKARLYWYNSKTSELTDMNATFDLAAGTATFYTDHLSIFLVANVINEGNLLTNNPSQISSTQDGNNQIIILVSVIAAAVLIIVVILLFINRKKKDKLK